MKQFKKLTLTLLLLITAAAGAWADDISGTISWTVGNEANGTVSSEISSAVESTRLTTGNQMTISNATYFETAMVKYRPNTSNAGNVEGVMIEYRVKMTSSMTFKPTSVSYAAVKVGTDLTAYSWGYVIDNQASAITDVDASDVLRNNGSNSSTAQLNHTIDLSNAAAGNEFAMRFYISKTSNSKDLCIGKVIISGTVSEGSIAPETSSGIEVTTNAASAQDIFTTASFTMPANDVTVNYTLVRDMQDATNPVAFSGLPSSGNIIVKKGDDGKYQPAEALTIQLIDPVAAADAQDIIAADGITIKVLVGAVNGQGAIDYDQDNPITLEAFLADMKPGYYWIKAEPTDENSPYDGTVYSSEFTLVEQYDLTVKPANDYSKGKLESVTVGTETVMPDATTGEATKTGVAPDTEVKLKAKRGYIIEKVETGKTVFIKLNAATAENIGMVVCNKGHLHDAKTAVPAGCTAVGILGKVTATGHGLILALKNAEKQTWNTINGWESVTTYAGTTLKVLPDDAARGTNLTSYTTLGETTVSNWAVAQKSDYEAIFTNLGSTTGDQNGKVYDDNVNAYITGAGGTAMADVYWSTTEYNVKAQWNFYYYCWYVFNKTNNISVWPVIGF